MMDIILGFCIIDLIIIIILYNRKMYLHYYWIRKKYGKPIEDGESILNTLTYEDRHYLNVVLSLFLIENDGDNNFDDIRKKVNFLILSIRYLIIFELLILLLVEVLDKI